MRLRAIKTKHYSCRAYLSSVSWAITLTYTLNKLSSFQNLRQKGGKFDHRPERPKVLLRHYSHSAYCLLHDPWFVTKNMTRERVALSVYVR